VKIVAIDPVCKMTVDEETAEFTTEHEGTAYYFCAAGCKAAFEEDPAKYLSGESEEPVSHEMPEEPAETQEAAAPVCSRKPWWKFW
jgi:YHS domain-containing protein